MRWYENADGSRKTHNRARTCEQCRKNTKSGCALPFRKPRKVRWLSALDKKPGIFGSLWFSRFMRSNAIAQGREHSERPAGAEG
jgi:hypothetical protein